MIVQESKILITGANGLVGTALAEELNKQGYSNLVLLTRNQCDLRDLHSVKSLFLETEPDIVFHTAAAVYGIGGNLKNRGSIFLDNILINTHVIEASRLAGVKKIVAMGTVAAYPEHVPPPIQEKHIWEGPPHGSESSYGHAKRAMLAQLLAYQENYGLDFAYVISTNLYGPHDKFDIEHGHVIPSLIRKFYEAKKDDRPVTIWGDGSASRDFLYSKDMARALIAIMQHFSGPINVGSGHEKKIREVVEVLTDHFSMQGKVIWDAQKPNGRKYIPLELSALSSLEFTPCFTLEQALRETANWFSHHYELTTIRS